MIRRPASRRLVVLALAGVTACGCAACGSAGDGHRSTQAGGTIVTAGAEAACDSPVRRTALVTQDLRGCFQLDGRPLVFPSGTAWGGTDGRTVRLPDGAQLRSGALVSAQVCSGMPTGIPQPAQFDCGIDRLDSVRTLVGPVSVQPVGP